MLTTILALTTLLVTAPADDPKAEARALVARGNKAFALGDHAGALSDFLAAYASFPSPKILLNVAESYRALGEPVGAVRNYERFLAESADPGDLVTEVQARIGELEGEVGRIEITGLEPGAQAEIDGTPWRAGAPLAVVPGSHRVTATAERFQAFEEEVTVAAGERATVEIRLVPMEVAPAPPPPAVAVTVTEEPGLHERWWFWAGLGALVVVGVTAGVVAATTGGDDFVPMGDLPRQRVADWQRF